MLTDTVEEGGLKVVQKTIEVFSTPKRGENATRFSMRTDDERIR